MQIVHRPYVLGPETIIQVGLSRDDLGRKPGSTAKHQNPYSDPAGRFSHDWRSRWDFGLEGLRTGRLVATTRTTVRVAGHAPRWNTWRGDWYWPAAQSRAPRMSVAVGTWTESNYPDENGKIVTTPTVSNWTVLLDPDAPSGVDNVQSIVYKGFDDNGKGYDLAVGGASFTQGNKGPMNNSWGGLRVESYHDWKTMIEFARSDLAAAFGDGSSPIDLTVSATQTGGPVNVVWFSGPSSDTIKPDDLANEYHSSASTVGPLTTLAGGGTLQVDVTNVVRNFLTKSSDAALEFRLESAGAGMALEGSVGGTLVQNASTPTPTTTFLTANLPAGGAFLHLHARHAVHAHRDRPAAGPGRRHALRGRGLLGRRGGDEGHARQRRRHPARDPDGVGGQGRRPLRGGGGVPGERRRRDRPECRAARCAPPARPAAPGLAARCAPAVPPAARPASPDTGSGSLVGRAWNKYIKSINQSIDDAAKAYDQGDTVLGTLSCAGRCGQNCRRRPRWRRYRRRSLGGGRCWSDGKRGSCW